MPSGLAHAPGWLTPIISRREETGIPGGLGWVDSANAGNIGWALIGWGLIAARKPE